MAAVVAIGLAANVRAHEVDPAAVPDAGLRATAAIAAAWSDARHPLPPSRLPGVLDTGQSWRDSRGLGLEHAVAELAGRSASGLGGQLAVGVHHRDRPHVESAWFDWRLADGLFIGGGRNTVPTTPAAGSAGHLDRFALLPLAKRAVFEGDWTDDGVALTWRPHDGAQGAWPDQASLGLWRGKAFPAGGSAPDAIEDLPITFGAGWRLGVGWQVDAFAAHMAPVARGRLIQTNGTGHTHGSPTCEDTLVGRACFDGQVTLWGATLTWTPGAAWTLSGTALLRDEQGALYSSGGDADYRGQVQGAWADAVWRIDPAWELAARFERVTARHDLNGPGASLVAQDAGLVNNRPSSRWSLAAAWLGTGGWRLSLEGGDDHAGGIQNPYVMLRALWRFRSDLGR